MAYIRIIDEDDAEDDLAREYAAARARAGKVFSVVKLQSQNPRVLRRGIALYKQLMYGESPLTRAEREMLAVVVSRYNDCHYWVRAHADDLRAEVEDDALVDAIADDPDGAPLERISDRAPALRDYARKLTARPAGVGSGDVQALRDAGCDDAAIHDAAQVIGFFAYYNRLADGLGVDPEPDWDGE